MKLFFRLHWVKGVVDCEDMPMNISRESMQDTRLMEKLSMAVVRRILSFLNDTARKQPEKYVDFYKQYSFFLKQGILEDGQMNGGKHKDAITKLLRYQSSTKDRNEFISLADYLDAAHPDQQNIYYFVASSRESALNSPYMEQFIQRGRNVLLLVDDIDEFVLNNLENFKGKKFVSIDSDKDLELDLDRPADENKDESRKTLSETEQAELEDFVKKTLGARVDGVRFSTRLLASPAVMVSQISPHMRRMMKAMMQKNEVGASDVPLMPSTLELNPSHPIITTLHSIRDSNPDVAQAGCDQIFDNASIAAGMLDEPRDMLDRLNKMTEMCVKMGAGYNYATNEYGEKPQAPKRAEEPVVESTPETSEETPEDTFKVNVSEDGKFEESASKFSESDSSEYKMDGDGEGVKMKM